MWTKVWDEDSQRFYYWNEETDETSWEVLSDYVLADNEQEFPHKDYTEIDGHQQNMINEADTQYYDNTNETHDQDVQHDENYEQQQQQYENQIPIANRQKEKFLAALEGFGPPPVYQPIPKLHSNNDALDFAPNDITKYFNCQEWDKKKKKLARTGILGVANDSDFSIYFVDSIDMKVLVKHNIKELTKFTDKRSKRLKLEFGDIVVEYEMEKTDIQLILEIIGQVKLRSSISGPITSGRLPVVGLMTENSSARNSYDQGLENTSSINVPIRNEYPSPRKASMVRNIKTVTSLYDYSAQTNEEIDIQEGDLLEVIDDTDTDWILVKSTHTNQQGLVPANYVEFQEDHSTVQKREYIEEQGRQQSIIPQRPPPPVFLSPTIQLTNKSSRASSEAVSNRPVFATSNGLEPVKAITKAPITKSNAHLPESSSTSKDKPKLDNLRTWTDKSGTFKVEAECTGILDGKAQLFKDNGVRITVPLDKLNPIDIAYLKTIPRFAALIAHTKANSIEEINSETYIPKPNFSINGFDWKAFLLAAGIQDQDASKYAQKLCEERLDKSIVHDIDRSVLRDLGVAEGDIVRLRRALGVNESIKSAEPVVAKAQTDGKRGSIMSINLSNSGATVKRRPSGSEQLKADEVFARELQELEILNAKREARKSDVSLNHCSSASATFELNKFPQNPKFSTQPPNSAIASSPYKSSVNPEGFKDAVTLLSENSRAEAEKSMIAAAIRASSVSNTNSSSIEAKSLQPKITPTSDPWKIFDDDSSIKIKSSSSPGPPPLPSLSTKPSGSQFNNGLSTQKLVRPQIQSSNLGKTIVVGPIAPSENTNNYAPSFNNSSNYNLLNSSVQSIHSNTMSPSVSGQSLNMRNQQQHQSRVGNSSFYYQSNSSQQSYSQSPMHVANQGISNISTNVMASKKPEPVGSWTSNVINAPASQSIPLLSNQGNNTSRQQLPSSNMVSMTNQLVISGGIPQSQNTPFNPALQQNMIQQRQQYNNQSVNSAPFNNQLLSSQISLSGNLPQQMNQMSLQSNQQSMNSMNNMGGFQMNNMNTLPPAGLYNSPQNSMMNQTPMYSMPVDKYAPLASTNMIGSYANPSQGVGMSSIFNFRDVNYELDQYMNQQSMGMNQGMQSMNMYQNSYNVNNAQSMNQNGHTSFGLQNNMNGMQPQNLRHPQNGHMNQNSMSFSGNQQRFN